MKKLDIIFAICMIIITIAIVVLVVKLLTPTPIYYTEFEKNGIKYIISTGYIVKE